MRSIICTNIIVLSFFAGLSPAQEWSQFLGPDRNGVWPRPVFSEGVSAGRLSLEERWRLPLGSGYSGVVISAGRLFTMTTDGTHDLAIALDAKTGSELWRTALADAYPGESGSRPGPLSTPAVARNAVVVVTPRGQLVVLETSDGTVRWRRDLVADFGAEVPLHGIATSPLVVEEQILVMVGGDRAYLTSFDAASGEVVWSENEGSGSSFASPLHTRLAGVDQIVVPSGELLYAVDPRDGSLLWSYPVADLGLIDRMPLVLPGDRLFLPLYSRGGVMLALEQASHEEGGTATAFEVTKLWQTTRINQSSHAPPVYFDGSLYGFSGSILVCLSAQDGTVRWRSRIYDGTLILIDGYLVIMSAGSGKLHVVEASSEAFEEVVSMPLLEVGQHTVTPPSYADGTVYVRNVQELVALDLGVADDQPKTSVSTARKASEGYGFAELWRRPLAADLESAGEAGLAVADGRVVTLIAAGTTEQAIAVDAMSGKEMWRVDLDASRPDVATAPGSSPTTATGRVFVISSECRLRSLDLTTGAVQWQLDLAEDYGPISLPRGCQTTPIVVGDRLAVQTGSEEGDRVVVVRQEDGSEVWKSKGLAATSYTSPVSTDLGGVAQILVHGYVARDESALSLLYSLDQADGSPLWSFEAERYFSWLRPVTVEEQVLLPTWRQTYLLTPPALPQPGHEARSTSEVSEVPVATEVWRNRTLDSAVYSKGTLFAYLDDDLVAINPESGDILWRENTFFGSLSLAGEHLAVVSFKAGVLRLVDVSAERYRERARLEVFNPGAVNYVWPVFADGRIYVRNREEMVALESDVLSTNTSGESP